MAINREAKANGTYNFSNWNCSKKDRKRLVNSQEDYPSNWQMVNQDSIGKDKVQNWEYYYYR